MILPPGTDGTPTPATAAPHSVPGKRTSPTAGSPAAPEAPVPWTARTVTRDGVRLSCRDWGGPGRPGHTVVLLHGLAGHAGEWDTTARLLHAAGHRVVAVDQRGHGHSERLPEDTSRAAHVADVVAVLDRLGLERPVLAGQSLGGHTALLTAAAHPGLLGGLVVVEAGPAGSNPDVVREIGDWFDTWPVPFASREAAVAFLGGGAVGEGWAAGLEERHGGLWPRFDPGVMLRSLAGSADRSWWAEWEAVDCPTLAVVAQHGIVEAAEIDGMLRRRPEVRAASVPGAGHDVHLEQPRVLHRLLTDFLACLGVRSSS